MRSFRCGALARDRYGSRPDASARLLRRAAKGLDAGIRAGAALLAAVLPAGPALAHASDRGHVLLLPTGYYAAGGAAAVAASFLVLAFLRPGHLAAVARPGLFIARAGEGGRAAVSMASLAVLAVLIAAGFLGSRDPLSNPLPLAVWTLMWVGLTLVQGLFGNLWAWINPWLGAWRAALALSGRTDADPPLRELPAALGVWPAVLFLLGFAWFELVYPAPDDPARLALAAGLYWLFSFLAMLVFGYETWSRRGEFLTVFFGMISRFGILQILAPAASPPTPDPSPQGAWPTLEVRVERPAGRGAELRLMPPGAMLSAAAGLSPSGTVFLLLALASVSFDGLSRTFFWLGANGVNPLEFPGRTAMTAINGFGLVLTFAALASVYFAAIAAGEWLAGKRRRHGASAGLMVWSIVPIALAYHVSHYMTALAVNGQYALVAISDPFALGWNLLGTAGLHVDAGIVMGTDSARLIWNCQAFVIVAGHMIAVLVAHGLACRLYGTEREAVLSQLPLALLMVGYTVFGLWLLSTPTVG